MTAMSEAPTADGTVLPPSPDSELAALRDLVSSAFLNHDPALVHIRAGALFARLKALNRAANHAARAHKHATAAARLEMDHTHLGLQNLLYEKRHLEREIDKCRQFACVPPFPKPVYVYRAVYACRVVLRESSCRGLPTGRCTRTSPCTP